MGGLKCLVNVGFFKLILNHNFFSWTNQTIGGANNNTWVCKTDPHGTAVVGSFEQTFHIAACRGKPAGPGPHALGAIDERVAIGRSAQLFGNAGHFAFGTDRDSSYFFFSPSFNGH